MGPHPAVHTLRSADFRKARFLSAFCAGDLGFSHRAKLLAFALAILLLGQGCSNTPKIIPSAAATLSATTVTFSDTRTGRQSSDEVLTLTNTGGQALVLTSNVLSDTVDFNLQTNCPSMLAAGAACTLTVQFHPQTAAVLNATVTVTDNSGGVSGAQQVIQLQGTGTPLLVPKAVLAPAALLYPDITLSKSSTALTLTLSNAGNAPLSISAVTLTDTQNFALNSQCSPSLPAGGSCTLAITFAPQTAGTIQAALSITDDSGIAMGDPAASVQQSATLSGKGISLAEPNAALNQNALVFPQTVGNTTAPPQSVTLTNTGKAPLAVANVSVSGGDAALFPIVGGNCTGMLAAGDFCTETIAYAPRVASTGNTATLIFTDNAGGQTGTTQSVALTGTALDEVDVVANFGDSLTCGFYAMPNDGTGYVFSLEGYAGLFDKWLGVPSENWCRQGDTAADLSRQWVPLHSTPNATGHQLYTLMIGTNDAYRYGIPPNALSSYSQEVGAAVAWLGMPNTDKVLGSAATQQTGTWSPDTGFGIMSSDAGASLSFTVNQSVAGRNLYLVYHVWNLPYGQAGKAEIAVDGVVQATVDESQNSGALLPTENGTQDTFLLQTVPLGAVGQHTVTFRSVGPGGSTVAMLWAGTPQGTYAQTDGSPRVLLGLVPNSPSGNQTYVAYVYSQQLNSLIPAMNADGFNVTIVPTDTVMDVSTDFADILHPNSAGHAKLAAAFEHYR